MNKWDQIFEDGMRFMPLNEIFLRDLLAFITSEGGTLPKSIVDLGCGDGTDLLQFAQHDLRGVGVDGSAVALSKAVQATTQARLSNLTFDQQDLDQMNHITQSDLFFCKLTYAFLKDKKKFLATVKQNMHQNSFFILLTPVLHPGIEYDEADKPSIGVDFEDTKKLLNTIFPHSIIFHHNYIRRREDFTTFVSALHPMKSF